MVTCKLEVANLNLQQQAMMKFVAYTTVKHDELKIWGLSLESTQSQ